MIPELIYLIKINTALILFYIFYRILFYKDTFFVLRRFILLGFIVSCFVYPFLNLQPWISEHAPIAETITGYVVPLPEITVEATPSMEWHWQEWLLLSIQVLYFMGVAVLLCHFIVQLVSVIWLKLCSQKMCIEGINLYVPEKDCQPFSFLQWIFINPEKYTFYELKEILTHERAHATQWHSLDVIVCELTCMICWFNPFAWLLKREIRHNLEYLADNTVLQSGYDTKSYQYHLLGLPYTQPEGNMYNNFNIHLKKRIIMMNQKRTHVLVRAKYLLTIPLVMALLLLNNAESIAGINQEKNSETPVRWLDEVIIVAYGKAKETLSSGNSTKSEEKMKIIEKVENTEIDQLPVYPGGDIELLHLINRTVKYPVSAQENGIHGRVIVSFTINEDGIVSDPEIVKSLDPLLDNEAIRIVEAFPPFEPAQHEGKTVKVKYKLPLNFRLQ